MRAGLTVAFLAATVLLACENRPRAAMGHPCVTDSDCETALACRQGLCVLRQDIVETLLEQSGAIDVTAERPVVGGSKVRVRQTTADNYAFASCRSSERLLGGGCSGGDDMEASRHLRSWPGDFTADDTLGARWYCLGTGAINAFALCQQTETSPE